MDRFVRPQRNASYRLVLLLLIFVVPLATQRSASAQPAAFKRVLPRAVPTTNTAEIVPGQLVVRVQPGLALQAKFVKAAPQFARMLGRSGTFTAQSLTQDTWLVNVGPEANIPTMAAQFAVNQDVVYAEPVYRWHATGERQAQLASRDPLVGEQWALNKIQAPQAWDVSVGSEAIIVASIDTGVNANHPDLQGRVLPGYNFVDNNTNASDDESHGTFGAGIIAAAGDNGVGVAGMCWRCRILPVKVLNARGEGTSVAAAQGVRWAVDHGARIINMSLGGANGSQLDHEAIQYAVSKGAIVIAAAGNEATKGNPTEYPAAYDEVFSVGATDINDQRAPFSNFGPYLDISAPGVDIKSTGSVNDLNGYDVNSGTSFAAPYVSGLAALLWSINPQLRDRDIMRIMAQTADDLGTPGADDYFGFGRINAGKAALAAKATLAPPPPPPPSTGQSITFPATKHTLSGTFLSYWQANGGLPVFGFPITEQQVETTADGTFWVQYFERKRFEYHPEKPAPYNVLLGRLGDDILKKQGRDWVAFPKATPGGDGCQVFAETQHKVCGVILKYWRDHGLSDNKLDPYGRSLQLWGLPLSEPIMETNSSGDRVLTQWFERARFEDHGTKGVLLGLLGNELIKAPATPPPPPPGPAPDCTGIPAPINGAITPSNCVKQGSMISMSINGFQPNEQIGFWLTGPNGEKLGTAKTLDIGPTGSISGLAWDTTGMPLGLWFWVFQGVSSQRQSIIYFKVLPR